MSEHHDEQARNDELRARLAEQNAELEQRVAANDAVIGDTGLTDEQVRRAEHPEEFASEDAPADAGDTDRSLAPLTAAPAPAEQTGTGHRETIDESSAAAVPSSPLTAAVDDDLSRLEQLEQGARELRRKLFGGSNG